MTQPKPPRWKRSDYGPYTLAGTDGKLAAEIRAPEKWTAPLFEIKTRNRTGQWNYSYAKTLPAAKRKATKMIREEAA